MPASTEKKRNSGVRKLETTGLTPMATPSGMATTSASTVPTSTRNRLAPMCVSSVPSWTPSMPACDHGAQMRKQPRVDVEIGNQHRPQHDENCKGGEKSERRREPSTKPHYQPRVRLPAPVLRPAWRHCNRPERRCLLRAAQHRWAASWKVIYLSSRPRAIAREPGPRAAGCGAHRELLVPDISLARNSGMTSAAHEPT